MACLHMKKKLSEYLDGALDAEEKAFVEEHMASCEDCADTFADLQKTVEHMRTLDEVEPPAWFTEKVMQRVRKEAGKKSLLRKLFFPLHIKVPAEAFALVLVAVVAVYVFDAMRPQMVMKEMAEPEPQIAAEEPEADVLPPGAFHHPEDEAHKPFAPTRAARAPEEEAAWEQEHIDEHVEAEANKFAAEEKARLRKEAPPAGEGLMKSEPSLEEFGAAEPGVVLGDAQAPEEAAEPERDTRTLKGATADLKAPLPEAGLKMNVTVEDIDFARDEIGDAIKRLGGRVIEEEGLPDNIVLAELGTESVDKLIEAAAEVGTVKSRALTAAGDKVLVRIELSESAGP
jgi:hypothetical protein